MQDSKQSRRNWAQFVGQSCGPLRDIPSGQAGLMRCRWDAASVEKSFLAHLDETFACMRIVYTMESPPAVVSGGEMAPDMKHDRQITAKLKQRRAKVWRKSPKFGRSWLLDCFLTTACVFVEREREREKKDRSLKTASVSDVDMDASISQRGSNRHEW